MKTLILSTLLLCWGATTFSSTWPTTECSFVNTETLTLAEQLVYILPDGMWWGKTPDGKEAALQFGHSGKAYWFVYDGGRLANVQDYEWAVYAPSPETAVLELSQTDGHAAYAFEVDAQCQSVTLANLETGASLRLNHQQGSPQANLDRMKELLDGKWENNTYPFDIQGIEGAYLRYRFYGTGKMERLCGSTSQTIRTAGEWQLSNDGQHIIMSFYDGATVVAEIKHLAIDELVLTHVLACEDQRFATGQKDFFFNRN